MTCDSCKKNSLEYISNTVVMLCLFITTKIHCSSADIQLEIKSNDLKHSSYTDRFKINCNSNDK